MFSQTVISGPAFRSFKKFIYDVAGIDLSDEKKTLVTSRLAKRLRHYDLTDFAEYFDLVEKDQPAGERQICVDFSWPLSTSAQESVFNLTSLWTFCV